MRPSADAALRWARAHALDIAALAAAYVGFFMVNDVRHWISAPYWLDESWVALSTRVPLTDLPQVTSTSPIGWTLLLRAVPDPDALRVVPLLFALLSVAAAYAFGWTLLQPRPGVSGRIERVVAGGLAASAVVLLPAAQQRHDLKQYTADAAAALALLTLTLRAERSGRRRDLGVLAAAGPVAFLLSSAAPVLAVAAFGGLLAAGAARRDRPLVVERLVAGAASGLVLVALYLALVLPARVPALAAFWRDYYPAPSHLVGYLRDRLRAEAPELGLGPWWLWLLLVAGGVVAIVASRAPATAMALVLLPVVLVVLGVLKVYPLLDERTSYFLFAVAAAVVGVGCARLVIELARRRPSLEPVLAPVLALAAVAAFALVNRPAYRLQNPAPIYWSDVRTQVQWIDTHRRPGDVVVISFNARYGYLFYHEDEPLRWTESTRFSHGWDAIMPDDPDVIAVGGFEPADIAEALDRAVQRARHNGPDARILLLRSWWWLMGEPEAWRSALEPYQVTYPYSGVEPVAVIESAAAPEVTGQ